MLDKQERGPGQFISSPSPAFASPSPGKIFRVRVQSFLDRVQAHIFENFSNVCLKRTFNFLKFGVLNMLWIILFLKNFRKFFNLLFKNIFFEFFFSSFWLKMPLEVFWIDSEKVYFFKKRRFYFWKMFNKRQILTSNFIVLSIASGNRCQRRATL